MMTGTQEQIMQLLLSKPEERLSIRQIARVLKKSYTLTYHNIKDLLKKGILESIPFPPAQMIQIKEDIPTSVLIDIERKRTEVFLENQQWMKLYLKDVLNAAKSFFIMIVFGSYAKGTQTKASDLDLLVIVPTKKDITIYEQFLQCYTKVKKSIIVIDAQNFIEMIKNPKVLNVGNEAKKHHIIIYGTEQYYQLLKQV